MILNIGRKYKYRKEKTKGALLQSGGEAGLELNTERTECVATKMQGKVIIY
jgi:hypothetical protein